MSHPSGFNISG